MHKQISQDSIITLDLECVRKRDKYSRLRRSSVESMKQSYGSDLWSKHIKVKADTKDYRYTRAKVHRFI